MLKIVKFLLMVVIFFGCSKDPNDLLTDRVKKQIKPYKDMEKSMKKEMKLINKKRANSGIEDIDVSVAELIGLPVSELRFEKGHRLYEWYYLNKNILKMDKKYSYSYFALGGVYDQLANKDEDASKLYEKGLKLNLHTIDGRLLVISSYINTIAYSKDEKLKNELRERVIQICKEVKKLMKSHDNIMNSYYLEETSIDDRMLLIDKYEGFIGYEGDEKYRMEKKEKKKITEKIIKLCMEVKKISESNDKIVNKYLNEKIGTSLIKGENNK